MFLRPGLTSLSHQPEFLYLPAGFSQREQTDCTSQISGDLRGVLG